jgi:hypothetical protein
MSARKIKTGWLGDITYRHPHPAHIRSTFDPHSVHSSDAIRCADRGGNNINYFVNCGKKHAANINGRSLLFIVILCIHAATIYFVTGTRKKASAPSAATNYLQVWLQLNAVETKNIQQTTSIILKMAAPVMPKIEQAPISITAVAPSHVTAEVATPAGDMVGARTEAAPKGAGMDLLGKAYRDIAQIDRDLRKNAPKGILPESAPPATFQTTLERGIRQAIAPKREQIVLPDGQIVVQTMVLGRPVCIWAQKAGATPGLDLAEYGPNAKTRSCPTNEMRYGTASHSAH